MIDLKKQGFNTEEITSLNQEAEQQLRDMFKNVPSYLFDFIQDTEWNAWRDKIVEVLAERARLYAVDAVSSALAEIADPDMYDEWNKFGEPTEDKRYPVMKAYHQIAKDLANYANDELVSRLTYRKFGL